MRVNQEEAREIRELAAEAVAGNLPVSAAAFGAAQYMIKNRDASLMEQLPKEVVDWLQDMIAAYRKHGKTLTYSNLGSVDHTDLVRDLIAVLEESH